MVLSFVAHAAAIFIYNTHVGVDGVIYQGVAEKINQSEDFWACGAFAGAYWPPLFCIYLASFYKIFGHTDRLFFFFNLLIALGTAVTARHFLKYLFDDTVGRWSALLFFNSLMVFYFVFYFKYELLTTLLFCLGLLFLFRNGHRRLRDLFISGLFLGLAALATGRMLAVVPAFLYIIIKGETTVVKRRAFVYATLFLTGIVLAVTPWTIRNYVCLDKFIPISANSGLNFYTGFNENAHGSYLHREQLPQPFDRHERTDNAAFYRGGIEFIKAHPGQAAMLLLKKVNLMWRIHYADSALIYPFFYIGIFLLPRFLPRSRRTKAVGIQLIVLFYTVFHCFFIARYYYILPLLPLVYGVAIACQRHYGSKLLEYFHSKQRPE